MELSMSPYRMAINNVARFIRNQSKFDLESKSEEASLDAFRCSEVLAIAFAMSKEDVLSDIVLARV